MPGIFGLTIETPAGAPPTGWSGQITELTSVSVTRELNKSGTFALSFPATAQQADQIVYGWLMTVRQERFGLVDHNGTAFTAPALLYKAKVLSHRLIFDSAGQAHMEVSGETYIGRYADTLIHTGKSYTAATLASILTDLLGSSALYSLPAKTIDPITITLNDMSILQALIKLAEVARCDVREGWNGVAEFVDQDARIAPSLMLGANSFDGIRFIQVEQGGPELLGASLENFAVISELPQVNYEGRLLANKITPVSTEWDGSPLTLENADSGLGTLIYNVQTGVGPSGNYYYISDPTSIALYGTVELQLVRSDIKNPSNDPTTRAAAKKGLLAIAAGEMLQRRSELLTFTVQPANGEDIYLLPGDKAYAQYKGLGRLIDGTITYVSIDQELLVGRRVESAGSAGVRLVTFDLVTPTISYALPAPIVAIPTPDDRQMPEPTEPKDPSEDKDKDKKPDPKKPFNMYIVPKTKPKDKPKPAPTKHAAKQAQNAMTGNGALQPCCADPTTDINDGVMMPVAP